MYINANDIYKQKMLEINNKINAKLQVVSGSRSFSSVLENTQKVTNGDAVASSGSSLGLSVQNMNQEGLPLANLATTSTSKTNVDAMIKDKSLQYGVNENLIKSVIQAESGFNSSVVSGAGAIGLMQLMPSTAKSLGVENPYDPEQNIDGGIRYLKDKINSYNGNIKMALAAYNCGPTKLNSLHITDINDPTQFSRLPKETQNYINKIMKNL
jgi:Soluble lytic murein transglycosylase and related regulatory proteins (some contain LysM/invasin domains)